MSTGKQEASIPDQKAWAKPAARANRVDIVRSFQDDAIAGSEIAKRTGLSELLAYCEAQADRDPVSAVVVWDADRLSRADSFRTAGVINRLMDAGVTRLLTQEGWIDFDSDIDRLLFNIKQDMSRAGYSKSLSKNVTRAAYQRAKEGKWVCGKPPHGYRVGGDGRLALADDAGHVETVRAIFRDYVNTSASQGDVSAKLNAAGVKGPRGGQWTRDAVRGVLLNRAYLGELVWNNCTTSKYHHVRAGEVVATTGRRKTGTKRKNGAADRVVVAGAHPALIDAATFDAAARKMRANYQKKTTRGPNRGEWVLSGLLNCGDCGHAMHGHAERKRQGERTWSYRSYFCGRNAHKGRGSCHSNRVRQERVVAEVAAALHEKFCTPTALDDLRAECAALAKRGRKGDDRERQRLRDRIAELDRHIDKGAETLLLCPDDVRDVAAAKLAGWRQDRDAVAGELARHEAAAENGAAYMGRVNDALASLRNLRDKVTTAPAKVARDLLGGLVSKVTLYFDHPRRMKSGQRTVLRELAVELTPDFNSLLGTGRSSRSASGTRTTPASARP
jgi:DNA invertase Pin-like site-specific DNA recombinase